MKLHGFVNKSFGVFKNSGSKQSGGEKQKKMVNKCHENAFNVLLMYTNIQQHIFI